MCDGEKAGLFFQATWSIPSRYSVAGCSWAPESCRVTCFHFYRRYQVSAQVSYEGAGQSTAKATYIHGTTFPSSSSSRLQNILAFEAKYSRWRQSARKHTLNVYRNDMHATMETKYNIIEWFKSATKPTI